MIKERLIQNVSKDPELSFRLAIFYLKKEKPVPEIILNSAISHELMGHSFARDIAEAYVNNEEPIPQIILKKVSENAKDAYYLAKHCIGMGRRIPAIIFDSVKNSQFLSSLQSLIIKSSSDEDDELKKEYPPIYHRLRQKVLSNPHMSFKYAQDLLKNHRQVPSDVVDSFLKNSSYALRYAQDLIKQKQPLPSNIEQSFQEVSDEMLNYLYLLQANKLPVPKHLEDMVASFPTYSITYAIHLLNIKKIAPQNVIESLATISSQAANYGSDFIKTIRSKDEKILKIIENGILKGDAEKSYYEKDKRPQREPYASKYALTYSSVFGELPDKKIMKHVGAKSMVLIANHLLVNKKEVPPIVIDKISTSGQSSYAFKVRYMAFFNKELPDNYSKINDAAEEYEKTHI